MQRSEWKYRTLVESSHDVIWAVDTAGRVLFCNRCVRDVLGYEPEELVGHALTDFVHEDEAARRMEGLRAGRPVHDAEVEAQRKDGTRVVLSVMGDVLRDETGKVIGATGTARDVGEQKRAARELQREKAFSDAVIASVPGTFYVVDRQGRFVRWNRAQEELTGLGAEQLAGLEALATIHEDDRPHVAAKLEEVFERGHAELEARLLAASGEVRHFHFTGKRMDVDGAAYLVGTGIDVTERKRAAEALRESEDRYRDLVENSEDLLCTHDLEGNILSVNPAPARTLGYDQSEMLRMNIRDVLAPEVRAVFEDYLAVLRREGVARGLMTVQTKAGQRRVWEYGNTLRTEGVSRPIVRGMAHDVTDRLRAERAVRKLTEDLERRVRERTAQLGAANKELEAFSYSVSHDLRAPLRYIEGFSRSLLERCGEQLDAEGQRYLARIQAGTERMDQLIRDLLGLSRVARAEMMWEVVNLSVLARSIAADLQRSQPQRRVEILIQPGIVARGDARLLHLALENLLANAWKYTGKHPSARIEFGTVERDGRPAYFVRDDGAGFDMRYAEKLFGAFQRLHSESEFEGTGVGLATVKRIVSRHEGEIWAEAVVESGATIYFTLSASPQGDEAPR